MKYFLLLVGLTIFNTNADDEMPKRVKDALIGDPYYDYMITCRNFDWTKMQECVDWVMMNINRVDGIVLHGVVNSAIQGNTTFHAQSFLIPGNIGARSLGATRSFIKETITKSKTMMNTREK